MCMSYVIYGNGTRSGLGLESLRGRHFTTSKLKIWGLVTDNNQNLSLLMPQQVSSLFLMTYHVYRTKASHLLSVQLTSS